MIFAQTLFKFLPLYVNNDYLCLQFTGSYKKCDVCRKICFKYNCFEKNLYRLYEYIFIIRSWTIYKRNVRVFAVSITMVRLLLKLMTFNASGIFFSLIFILSEVPASDWSCIKKEQEGGVFAIYSAIRR